jgi:hypothetical protein
LSLIFVWLCIIDIDNKEDNQLDAGRWSGSRGTPFPDCPATYWVHYTTSCITQSNALEDGQNNCLKHGELIGIINKLLHLVGCLYYLRFVLFHAAADCSLRTGTIVNSHARMTF